MFPQIFEGFPQIFEGFPQIFEGLTLLFLYLGPWGLFPLLSVIEDFIGGCSSPLIQ